ncbi:TnsD family Tn7-like transposition protein [Thermosediminibacter litoriperuensis]
MLNSNEKPERITINLIGNKLGMRGFLEKHLEKMPLTKQYLDSVKESKRDFQLRGIK